MTQGRSIRLFLVDGTPTGIITAEIMNWTGHVIVAPRSRLADFVQRQEAGRTGVYCLVGDNPETSLKPLVYIGETDNVGKRLVQHNKDESKDFFDRFCVVTSKDQNLTKAHVRYLESRLIDIALKAELSKTINGTAPDFGRLPEADLADMEFFVEQIRTVFPVLGLSFLRAGGPVRASGATSAATATEIAAEPVVGSARDVAVRNPTEAGGAAGRFRPSTVGVTSPQFETRDLKAGIVARAIEIDGEIVVEAGSTVRVKEGGSLSSTLRQMRTDFLASGVLKRHPTNPQVYLLTRDVAFNSPSQASSVIFGHSSNGRTAWLVVGTKQTYADWQQAQIAAHAPQGGEE